MGVVRCDDLEELQKNIAHIFHDLLLLKILDWVIHPFLYVSREETGEEELVNYLAFFNTSYFVFNIVVFTMRKSSPVNMGGGGALRIYIEAKGVPG